MKEKEVKEKNFTSKTNEPRRFDMKWTLGNIISKYLVAYIIGLT